MAKAAATRARNLKAKLDEAIKALEDRIEADAERRTGMMMHTFQSACLAVQEDMESLQAIIEGGKKARNASARVRALELKWGYGYGRPRQQIDLGGYQGGPVEVHHRVTILRKVEE